MVQLVVSLSIFLAAIVKTLFLLGELEDETVIVMIEFSVLHYFIFLDISGYSPLDLFC